MSPLLLPETVLQPNPRQEDLTPPETQTCSLNLIKISLHRERCSKGPSVPSAWTQPGGDRGCLGWPSGTGLAWGACGRTCTRFFAGF